MADFSFPSSTDESDVEEILSEVADHISLQQLSVTNLSDSALPNHLDTRFRRLKTFPSSESPQTRPLPLPVNSGPKFKLRLPPSHSSSSASSSSPEWKAAGRLGLGRRSGSVSPPMSGCLCFSPRKNTSRKKSFRVGRLNDDVIGKLAEGSMSRGNQEKIMTKAVMEEMKIVRDAEKIVELALHASARMDSHGVVHESPWH